MGSSSPEKPARTTAWRRKALDLDQGLEQVLMTQLWLEIRKTVRSLTEKAPREDIHGVQVVQRKPDAGHLFCPNRHEKLNSLD